MKAASWGLLLTLFALPLTMTAATTDEPKRLQPLNLPINTEADEEDPSLASNGLILYYASNAAKGKFDIMLTKRANPTAKWGSGALLNDYVRTEAHDRGASLTPEGKYPQFIYFSTRKDKDTDNYDLYVCVRLAAGKAFTEPTPVQATATADDEMHPWLAADGKQLYFSRKEKGVWKQYVCTRQAATGAQGFDKPERVDLPPDFHHATLAPDGKTLYVQGRVGRERWGLFVCTKTSTGWSKPVELTNLNHPEGKRGDLSPSLSRDGKELYFVSDRPGGKGGLDIWMIPTTDLAKK
jgi:Tol biopolymer transport system component